MTEMHESIDATAAVDAADSSIDRRHVLIALGVSIGGHLAHNLAEFPLDILVGLETLVPVVVTVLLGVALLWRPGRSAYVAAAGWAVIVIVGGGATVLPLSVLPFAPEQTVGHYAVHGLYALAQLPLLWFAWRGLSPSGTA